MTTLTYIQANPDFLDFLYPFGDQQYQQDSCFNDFRPSTRLAQEDRGLQINELGRSGLDLRLCYSLKGVEAPNRETQSDWSIRQASIYHSFDIEIGTTNWIMIKGDDLLQERIAKLTTSRTFKKLEAACTRDRLFAASFLVHLLICDWAAEQWRWYLNYIEEEAQQVTRATHAILVDDGPSKLQFRRSTLRATLDVQVRQASRSPGPRRQYEPVQGPADYFKFGDLRRLLFLEEKVINALTVIESNNSVISRMHDYYQSVTSAAEWPSELSRLCGLDIKRFLSGLKSVQSNLSLQEERAKGLLKNMENQRTMVSSLCYLFMYPLMSRQLYGILEYENIKASKQSTQQTLDSATTMEELTQEMAGVAFTTARQTAFMVLIALVTIVYLPATFISVRALTRCGIGLQLTLLQTIWSTDIVQWGGSGGSSNSTSDSNYDGRPLKIFLAVSLPLTFATIFACYIGYRLWARRSFKLKELASRALDHENFAQEKSAQDPNNASRSLRLPAKLCDTWKAMRKF